MNNNGHRKLWGSPNWSRRLIEATQNKIRASLVETPAWNEWDPYAPPETPDQWQYALFYGAVGGMTDLVTAALDNGADRTKPLTVEWLGVGDGELQTCRTNTPAYYWLTNRKAPESLIIWTAVEAAIAGACTEAINILANEHLALYAATLWTTSIPLDLPRIASGISVCECLANHGQLDQINVLAPHWLTKAQDWLNRHATRNIAAQTQWERIVQIRRQLQLLANPDNQPTKIALEPDVQGGSENEPSTDSSITGMNGETCRIRFRNNDLNQ